MMQTRPTILLVLMLSAAACSAATPQSPQRPSQNPGGDRSGPAEASSAHPPEYPSPNGAFDPLKDANDRRSGVSGQAPPPAVHPGNEPVRVAPSTRADAGAP
jgi:hypothetical protein